VVSGGVPALHSWAEHFRCGTICPEPFPSHRQGNGAERGDYPIVAEPNQPLTHSMCWSTARSPGGTQFVLLLNPYAPPPQIEKCFDGWVSAVR